MRLQQVYNKERGIGIRYYTYGASSEKALVIFNAIGRRGDAWCDFCKCLSNRYIVILDMDVFDIRDNYIDNLSFMFQYILDTEKIREMEILTWCSGTKLYTNMISKNMLKITNFLMLSPDFAHFRNVENQVSEFEKNMNKLNKLIIQGEGKYVFDQYVSGFWGQELSFDNFETMKSVFGLFEELTRYDYSVDLQRGNYHCISINGMDDKISPLENNYIVNKLFPFAKVEEYEGIGHYFFSENPMLLAQIVDNFFQKKEQAVERYKHSVWKENQVHSSVVQCFKKNWEKKRNMAFVVDEIGTFSFDDIEKTSNQLANELILQGIGTNNVVGLIMQKTAMLVSAIIAVMKVGAAYMIINTELPETYLEKVKFDSTYMFLIEHRFIKKWIERYKHIDVEEVLKKQAEVIINFNQDWPGYSKGDDELAMISLTSGSTGNPKQVKNQVFDITMLMEHLDGLVEYKCSNRIYMMLVPSFNFGIESILYAIYSGKILYLRNANYSIESELEFIKKNHINLLYMPSELLKIAKLPQLIKDINLSELRAMVVAGSNAIISNELLFSLDGSGIVLYNDYGISEYLTLFMGRVSSQSIDNNCVSIGQPIRGIEAVVIDKEGAIVTETKRKGILYVSKSSVNPQFIFEERKRLGDSIWVDDKLFFNTKDIAYFDDNGLFYIVGRSDNCCKIRGKRVYLEEVESIVLTLESIDNAIAYVVKNIDEQDVLAVEYVSEEPINHRRCIELLSKTYPEYMIPRIWKHCNQIRLNLNGKINRKSNEADGMVDVMDDVDRRKTIIMSLDLNKIRFSCTDLMQCTLEELGFDSLELMILETNMENKTDKIALLKDMTLEKFLELLK